MKRRKNVPTNIEQDKKSSWQQLCYGQSYGSKTSYPFSWNVFDCIFMLESGFNHGSDTKCKAASAVWLVVPIPSASYYQGKVKVAK